MGTAQAGGVIALAAAKRGIDVHFHTPSEVKAAVTGNGARRQGAGHRDGHQNPCAATKPTPADAADALALAICHCWRAPMIARMAAAEAHGRRTAAQVPGTPRAARRPRTMIASVRGEVLDVALDHVVIEAAGVGYKVMATPVDAGDAAPRHRGPADHRDDRARGLDDAVRLRRRRRARPVPDAARRCPGSGPRSRWPRWRSTTRPTLRQALADGDVTALTRVPGIGKRGAERMVLELRDKVGAGGDRRRAAGGQRPRGARPGGGSPCRTWLCGQAGRRGHRQGAGRRPGGRPRPARCGPRCRCWGRPR